MSKKSIRETAGYTQRELAKKLGVSRSTLQRFEAGTSSNKKLQQFYARQEKKNIRDQYGFTQTEIAEALGVSKSTVSRYETSGKNKKVEEFYKNLEKNRDLYEEFSNIRKAAKDRVKDLWSNSIEFSPALKWLEDRGLIPSELDLGKSRRELKQDISNLNQFLDMQTSTVQGANIWLENVEKASMQTSMSGSEDENTIFWKLFNRLKGDKTISKYWGKGYFDSDQAVDDIQGVMVYNYAGYETVDDLYDILTRS